MRSAEAAEGAPCIQCGAPLRTVRGIEVGNIFKLGTKYSQSMEAEYLDAEGQRRPLVMGCYGIGVGRLMAAAIEQRHDAKGMIWPEEIAPFAVHIVALNVEDTTVMETNPRASGVGDTQQPASAVWVGGARRTQLRPSMPISLGMPCASTAENVLTVAATGGLSARMVSFVSESARGHFSVSGSDWWEGDSDPVASSVSHCECTSSARTPAADTTGGSAGAR